MRWNDALFDLKWSQEITNYNEKLIVAKKIAALVKNNDVIGFGSGSTSFLAVHEISKRICTEQLTITAIPASSEIRMVLIQFLVEHK